MSQEEYEGLPHLLANILNPDLLWIRNYTSRKKNVQNKDIQFQSLNIASSAASSVTSSAADSGLQKSDSPVPEMKFQNLQLKSCGTGTGSRKKTVRFSKVYEICFTKTKPPATISTLPVNETEINFTFSCLILHPFQLLFLRANFPDVSFPNVDVRNTP